VLMRRGDAGPVPADGPGEGTAARTPGRDGGNITDSDLVPPGAEASKAGIFALEDADIFNLLVLPPLTATVDPSQATWNAAAQYCQKRRAMLLVDPPQSAKDPGDIISAISSGHNL